MAYNTTKAQKQRAAAKDLAHKMRRERILKAAIFSAYFFAIGRDLRATYAENGILPNLTEHNVKLNDILSREYKKTQNTFDSQVRDALGTPNDEVVISEQIATSLAVQQLLDVYLSHQSIADTTQKSLADSVDQTIAEAREAGTTLSQEQVAKKARKKFINDSKGRLETIGITETQGAAEGAKQTEISTLQRLNAVFPGAKVNFGTDRLEKTWVAVLDSRTRAAHAEADGQTVPVNEAYTVGGQQLMVPGDTSLGATLDNIINCRCSSVKSIHRAA